MDTFNVGSSLKLQSYLNNQTLDNDTMDFLENVNFRQLMTKEEFTDIYNKVQRYRVLEQENIANPSSDISKEMQELSQDVMYSTGSPIHSINMSKLKTNDDLEQAMLETNIRSKNDLFVEIDYDNGYSSTSNYVKCRVVGHDCPYAYGIAANARMAVTKSGKIITTRNALYMK